MIKTAEIPRTRTEVWTLVLLGSLALIFFLTFYHLTGYPALWYDEGSYLHVPKTLVQYGRYADLSSEGFRYYGPTVGVGPTVLLPIALVFKLFGIGLLQARLVMAVYLIAAVLIAYSLARRFGSRSFAWVAAALILSSRGVGLLEYGRQVLGEVPGLFFLFAGLAVWLSGWERASNRRLLAAGLLMGLAAVTKPQNLLVLIPGIGLAWLVNLLYYRLVPQRNFVIPTAVILGCYALWQVYMILYLGPANASQNFTLLEKTTAGAALVFSPALMVRSLGALAGLKVYLGILFPALIYGFLLVLPRSQKAQRWSLLYALMMANLVWFVTASIGWIRYAFPGLAIAGLFVAQFFFDLTDGFQLEWKNITSLLRRKQPVFFRSAVRWVVAIWLAATIVLPLGRSMIDILFPPADAAQAMAAYLDENIPTTALIETWEPEMGFLTDHRFHYPPPEYLDQAVAHIWLDAPSPGLDYHFVPQEHPAYVLVGQFARWVDMYSPADLDANYRLVTSIGSYDLYALR